VGRECHPRPDARSAFATAVFSFVGIFLGVRVPVRTLGYFLGAPASFCDAVENIVFVGADEKMPVVEARGIVATMKNFQRRINIESLVEMGCNAVNFSLLSFEPTDTVTTRVSVSGPIQAASFLVERDSLKQSDAC
jgi:hypothetical protein